MIGISIKNSNDNIFYLYFSSLITSKFNKEVGVGKSKRFECYKCYKLHLICNSLGIKVIVPINKRNSKVIDVGNIKEKNQIENFIYLSSKESKRKYRKRWEIDRVFGNLKESYGIDNHRI